jgi:hypothetical protein
MVSKAVPDPIAAKADVVRVAVMAAPSESSSVGNTCSDTSSDNENVSSPYQPSLQTITSLPIMTRSSLNGAPPKASSWKELFRFALAS